jgi:hypothetical protein
MLDSFVPGIWEARQMRRDKSTTGGKRERENKREIGERNN